MLINSALGLKNGSARTLIRQSIHQCRAVQRPRLTARRRRPGPSERRARASGRRALAAEHPRVGLRRAKRTRMRARPRVRSTPTSRPAGVSCDSSAVGTCSTTASIRMRSNGASPGMSDAAVAVHARRHCATRWRLQPRLRLDGQRAVALDRDHLARQPRQDRGAVARAGADLEHAVLRAAGPARRSSRPCSEGASVVWPQAMGSATSRQREVDEAARHEAAARHGLEGPQHVGVAQALARAAP